MSFRDNLKNGFTLATVCAWLLILWRGWKGEAGATLGEILLPMIFHIVVSLCFPLVGYALFRLITRRQDTLVANIGAWLGMLTFAMALQSVSYGEYIPFVQGTIAGFTLAFMFGWEL